MIRSLLLVVIVVSSLPFTSAGTQMFLESTQAQQAAMNKLQQQVSNVQFSIIGANRIVRIWGVPFAYGSSPEEAVGSFVMQYRELFAPGESDLVLEGTQPIMNGKFTAVYFKQILGGLPVDRGYLTFLVRNETDFPVVLASSNVQTVKGKFGKPLISDVQALDLVRKANPTLVHFSKPELVIYPGEMTHLAWSFTGDNLILENREKYLFFIDANTGSLLERRDQVLDTDVYGHVEGWFTPGLLPDQNNNPEVIGPLGDLLVSIIGGNSAYTNANGDYVIANAGTSQVTVQAELKGHWVRVVNRAGANLVLQQTVIPPGPANFEFNTDRSEFNTAQVNGFIHTEKVHDFVKSINRDYPGVDVQLPCNVNINSTCNAYYDYSSINFYRAGGGCPNTAYSTVIYHEYGHHIVASGHSGATSDYHEGMADVTAAMLTNDPCLARDFFGQGSGCLRNSDNNVQYPCSGEPHYCGQVISGCFWHTLDAMKQRYQNDQQRALDLVRSWYLNSILLRPPGITPQITIDVLTLDDDDGNIYNGTPHYPQIREGFSRHNMPPPDIDYLIITPIQLPSDFVAIEPATTSIPFIVQVRNGVGQVDPNNVYLYYSVDGGAFQRLQLVRSVGPDIFSGFLARPPCGSAVKYYIEALDTEGRPTRYPRNAPAETLQFVVGRELITLMEDTFETDTGWTVQNSNLSTGAWTRDDPNGTFYDGQRANPEDDSDDPGTFCYFTGQGTRGGSVGEQDVDGGPTYLISPTFNLAGGNALVTYRRWFFNDDGDDSLVVEVSNDNGATWRQVETVTGIQNRWTEVTFVLSNYVPPSGQVKLRFRTADNPNNSITEAAVDYVVVRYVRCN